uniref:Si:ch73-138n13.1 n=1 Tax=Cyprinus carpio TaxID=7962 RepID=A0A8C1W5R9_CYPCA
MAAQVEVDAGRPCVVGSRLHLSPLIDSSNKSLVESSGGTQGPLIIPSEPNKPVPGPKPRLTPKPFTVEKNPAIRSIFAPKPQPKPKPEPSRPVSSKPVLPSAPKPQPASKPSLPPDFKTGSKPSGQTNKPVAQPFKPAPTIASTDSNKFRTTQTGDVPRRTSFGATPARPKTVVQASTPGAEWPFAPRKKQPGSSITRAKSMGFLSEIGLNNEDSKEDSDAKAESSPTVLRPQSKGSRPRPVSAVFLQNPTKSESQVVSPTPAPRWTKGRPLSSDLTSKFESIGLSLNRRPAKEASKENTSQMPESAVAETQEKEQGAEKAEGPNKSPVVEKRTQKIESKDEDSKKDSKPEDTGGSSIKRRISLLLDSSSSSSSVARVDTPGTEPPSPGLSVSDTDGAVGVKQRIKELTEEVPTTLSPPQKPQCKPRTLVSDRTKRFEAELESHSSYELKSPQQAEEDLSKKKRSRSMCRRSAPTEISADGPLTHVRTRRSRSAHKERSGESSELVKQCVSGQQENKDTDNLVQETDSQYSTWETGLRTDDSLTPATTSSDDNLSPSPRKPTPPHTAEQPLLIDTPDGLTTSPQKQTELPFPETPTTLLDSSALRARVSLNKKSTRRAPPSRVARHSALLSQVPEGIGADDEWRYKDSTEEKTDSPKQGEDSDSEEQAKGIESRTSSVSQPQRVALFPGMDPSALKAQLKKRGESDNQTDGPTPPQLSRTPKSPFLPRASRVLPPAGGKENVFFFLSPSPLREEASPQWLKELKTKKRLSQYENDGTA